MLEQQIKMKYCSINGESTTNLDINDRGIAYGDGLFTTAKIVNGRVELLNQHVNRLVEGCNKLAIPLPISLSQDELTKQLRNIAKSYTLAVLKVMITAGSGGRGYSRIGLADDATNTIVMVFDFPEHYNELAKSGINLGLSKQKISISPMLAGIKHLNRLEQVLLRRELDQRTEDDLVVMNVDKQVVEATSANLFYWVNGELYTPDVSLSGVNGLMRQFIMANYCKYYNSEVSIEKTTLTRLQQADSMFTCNSVTGVMPVKTFDKRLLNLEPAYTLRHKIQELIGD